MSDDLSTVCAVAPVSQPQSAVTLKTHSLILFASPSAQTYYDPIEVQYELTTEEKNVVFKGMSWD